ncbi:MAG: DNA repair protein RecO [Cyclobacteriaceae bacterium]|nr:DNA repair protein RecO [Cyclobacteriaceae bacterium]
MLHKTRGIVFRFTKYGESSIIVTIFTELFGIQTYIVNGIRSKNSKGKIALFQPLTLLDLVVYYKENANIKRIKEVKCAHQYQALTTDIRKSIIAIFISEMLNKTVKDETHAQEIFEFLFHALMLLDHQQNSVENFHLVFLIKLSRFLGFGAHQADEILGARMLDSEEEAILKNLLQADFTEQIVMTNVQRRNLLEAILRFYTLHIESLGEIKSVQVLRDVMS